MPRKQEVIYGYYEDGVRLSQTGNYRFRYDCLVYVIDKPAIDIRGDFSTVVVDAKPVSYRYFSLEHPWLISVRTADYVDVTLGKNFSATYLAGYTWPGEIESVARYDLVTGHKNTVTNKSIDINNIRLAVDNEFTNYGHVNGNLELIGGSKIINQELAFIKHISLFDTYNVKLKIDNFGTIGYAESESSTIFITQGRGIINNYGRIEGYVILGDERDIFRNMEGAVAPKLVAGGYGADDYYILGDPGRKTLIGEPPGTGKENWDRLFIDTIALKKQYDSRYVVPDNLEMVIVSGKHNVSLYGNAQANALAGDRGNDYLFGGGGKDVLAGGRGRDILEGGADTDIYLFLTGDSAKKRAKADVIVDFESGDRIELDWDADRTRAGVQDFTFIGFSSFSGRPGEVGWVRSGGQFYVAGNTNRDRKAEFYIKVEGDDFSFGADSFIL